ncbi:MAG: YitT family protein [Desulfobacterales bacterium]
MPYPLSVPWNLLLITAGSAILALALKGIAFPYAFIPGGMFGVASLVYFAGGAHQCLVCLFEYSAVYHRLEIHQPPVFCCIPCMPWFLPACACCGVDFRIHDQFYAAVTCGVLSGLGAGIVLRSLGSTAVAWM